MKKKMTNPKVFPFGTEDQINGTFAVIKYDILKKKWFRLKGEIYLRREEAILRARELNQDIDPVELLP